MTSKNLFFKLMKENTKQRLWTVALITLIFFFAFPVQTALNISSALDQEQLSRAADAAAETLAARIRLGQFFMEWFSDSNVAVIMLMFLFAVVCGVSGYSYLYSRKKTDFYHSLPIRRELLFAVQYVSGVLYVAIPYLISVLIAAIMVFAKDLPGFSFAEVMKGWLVHMSFFLLLYSTVITAVVMTGNLIVSLLGTLVFFFWGPGVLALILGYYSAYYLTYYQNSGLIQDWYGRLSPAYWYSAAVGAEHSGSMAVKGLAAAAVITLLAVILYKKRPSEAAGRAMAFRISQPVIKILLVVPFALWGSLLFHSMMGKDGWSIFGLLCGLLISYAVIEIIYHFDFKRMFAHKRQLVFCGVISAAILAIFRFDLSGYDSYLPSEERLESMGLFSYAMEEDAQDRYQVEPELVRRSDGDYRYIRWNHSSTGDLAERMYLEEMAPALEIARQGVGDVKRQRQFRFSPAGRSQNYWEEGAYVREVVVTYHLTSGKTVFRRYMIELSAVRDSLDAVYNQQSFKNAVYPVLSHEAEKIAGINYQEHSDFRHVSLADEEQKEKLLTTYQKELSALTAETRRQESPVAALQFKTLSMQAMIDEIRAVKADYTDFNRYLYFPVYPSFKETIALLKECGIEVGTLLNKDNADKLVLDYYGTYPENVELELEITQFDTEAAKLVWADWKERELRGSPSVTVTDKDQIQQILDSAVSSDLNCSNSLNETYGGLRIHAYVPYDPYSDRMQEGFVSYEYEAAELTYAEATAESYGSREIEQKEDGADIHYMVYNLYFDYDKVPDFVKQVFGLTEELMEQDKRRTY